MKSEVPTGWNLEKSINPIIFFLLPQSKYLRCFSLLPTVSLSTSDPTEKPYGDQASIEVPHSLAFLFSLSLYLSVSTLNNLFTGDKSQVTNKRTKNQILHKVDALLSCLFKMSNDFVLCRCFLVSFL